MELIEKFLGINSNEEKKEYIEELEVIKQELIKTKLPEDLVKISILNFLKEYNPMEPFWKNKNIQRLIKDIKTSYKEKNIVELILKSINENFMSPSPLRSLISFQKKIPKEKSYLECCFKLILLTKNIKLIINEIKTLLSIQNTKLENLFEKMSLENPYAIILVREIVSQLIINGEEKDIKEILSEETENLKNYYLFHCPICLEIQFIYINDQKEFSLVCKNNHEYNKDKVKNLQDLKLLTMLSHKCNNCHKNIELFENGLKCLKCDDFFCHNCSLNHRNECIKFNLVNIYDIGFVCPVHCKKYVCFCFLCDINLCQICKENHFHIIKKTDFYKTKDIINSYFGRNYEQNNLDMNILSNLFRTYNFMENFGMINFFINKSIYFSVYKDKATFNLNTTDFYSQQFFDDEFVAYYSRLIKDVANGKSLSKLILSNIKKEYDKKKINCSDIYTNFIDNPNLDKRDNILRQYISNLKGKIYDIDSLNKYMEFDDTINTLNIKLIEKEDKISVYKFKIISLFRKNDYYQTFIKDLLGRYLSDIIIRLIIKKYPESFKRINLNIQNSFEIMSKNLNEKTINEFTNLKNNLNKIGKNEKEISDFLKKINNDNLLVFNKSIKVGDHTFSIDELNFVLQTLFYLKNKGNIIAHLNIDSSKNIKIDDYSKDINEIKENINNILNNSNKIIDQNNDEKNENLSKKDSKDKNDNIFEIKQIISTQELKNEIKEKVENKLINIKKEILKYFDEIKNKEIINIEEMLDFIFNNQIKNIFVKYPAFLRRISLEIDSIIKEDSDVDLTVFNKKKSKLCKIERHLKSLFYDEENSYDKLKINYNEKRFCNYFHFVNKCFQEQKFGDLDLDVGSAFFLDEISKSLSEINIDNTLDEQESKALVYHLGVQYIKKKELEKYNKNIINFNNELKSFASSQIVNKKLKKIYEIFKDEYFGKSSDNEDLINEVKSMIKKQRNKEQLFEKMPLDISLNNVYDIIKSLVGKDRVKWLEIGDTKISLGSYLYMCLNK